MKPLERYNNHIFAYHYEYTEGSKSNHGDIEYYQQKLKGCSGEVLELACGTGRITIPLAKSGVKITGVDNASAMIEIAQKKCQQAKVNIPFIIADATTFTSDVSFAAAFIPYNSISFINNDSLKEFADFIRSVLTPGGKFLFDIGRHNSELYDESGRRVVDWCALLYIEELDLFLRRRMELQKHDNVIETSYFWEIRENQSQEVEKVVTTMPFSSYQAEDYINIFTNTGFALSEINEKSYIQNGLQRVHCYVEMTSL